MKKQKVVISILLLIVFTAISAAIIFCALKCNNGIDFIFCMLFAFCFMLISGLIIYNIILNKKQYHEKN